MSPRRADAPGSPPRAVLYLRQSTYREESISLELQESAGREHCARHGYDLVEVLADPGVSGRTWRRPAVRRAMAMLEQHEADVVVLWRWSRPSRSRKDRALAADRADVAGGRIESATEPNDVTAAGRFARGVMTELAAFESERIGEQWKDVHARRVGAGLPVSGGPRFGYRVVDGAFVPDPATAPVLAALYRRDLEGDGLVALTRRLRDAGHVSPYSGKPYTHRGVAPLLDAGFGAGVLQAHGEHVAGAHEAAVDEATWRRYRAERARRATVPPGGAHTAARDELLAERAGAGRVLDDLAATTRVVDGADAAASTLLEGWDCLPSARVSAILRELVTVWVTKNPAGGCDVVARGTWEE